MQHVRLSKIVLSLLIILLPMIFACGGIDEGRVELTTEGDSLSYCFGVTLGLNIKSLQENDVDVNIDVLISAFRDVTDDRTLLLAENDMAALMQKFQNDMQTRMMEKSQKELAENQAEASAFLAENAKKPGVITLPDNLQYEVIETGTGPSPKMNDIVKVHYTGMLIDGTEFDSSYNREPPVPFEITIGGGVIMGWTEILQLMKVGDKWRVFIPPELAYGQSGRGQIIGPNTLLIFEMELMEIMD